MLRQFSLKCFRLSLVGAFVFAWSSSGYAQSTQEDVREFVQLQLRNKKLSVTKPEFTNVADDQGDVLLCYLEGMPKGGDYSASAEPLKTAFREQCRVEALRENRPRDAPRDVWNSMLSSVEEQIQWLMAGATELNDDELEKLLKERRESIREIYQASLDQVAKSRGHDAADIRQRYEAGIYWIEFSARPGNAEIQLIPAGDWDYYRFLTETKKRSDVPKPNWRTIVLGQKTSLSANCNYWFHVKWANGQVYRSGSSLRIISDDPIQFTPAGPSVQ